jgi:transcriptional regulator
MVSYTSSYGSLKDIISNDEPLRLSNLMDTVSQMDQLHSRIRDNIKTIVDPILQTSRKNIDVHARRAMQRKSQIGAQDEDSLEDVLIAENFERDGDCLLLRFFYAYGYSQDEIANQLGQTQGRISQRLKQLKPIVSELISKKELME